jgi:hypothetical protein
MEPLANRFIMEKERAPDKRSGRMSPPVVTNFSLGPDVIFLCEAEVAARQTGSLGAEIVATKFVAHVGRHGPMDVRQCAAPVRATWRCSLPRPSPQRVLLNGLPAVSGAAIVTFDRQQILVPFLGNGGRIAR